MLGSTRLCSAQNLQWRPSRPSPGTGLYPLVQTRNSGNRAGSLGGLNTQPYISGTMKRLDTGQVAATGLPLASGLHSDTFTASSSKYPTSSGNARPTLATFPSPTAKVGGTWRSLSVLNDSRPVTALPQSSIPTTSAASSTQIPIVILIRNILGAGQSLSAKITILISKTKLVSSIECTEPFLQQRFDSIGGTSITSIRGSRSGRGILRSILQLVGRAINGLEHSKAHMDAHDRNKPNFPSINQFLPGPGEVSNQIAEEEKEQSKENRSSMSTSDSHESKTATSKTSSSSSTVTGPTLSSLSKTSSMSSSRSSKISKILDYHAPVIGYPGPLSSLGTAANDIFDIIGSVLMSAYYITRIRNFIFLELPSYRSVLVAPGSSLVSALIHNHKCFGALCNTSSAIHQCYFFD